MPTEISEAREVMRKAFERSPDFKRVYRDNIAMCMYDNLSEDDFDSDGDLTPEARNKVAEKIIDIIFW